MKQKTIVFVGPHFQQKEKLLKSIHGGMHPARVKSEQPWQSDRQYQFLSGLLTGIAFSLVVIGFVCMVVFVLF